jgi:aminoglycoside 3-N-acetyltransferase I
MRAMLSMFGRAFSDMETYCARQPEDRYLRDLLGRDSFIAIAALVGTAVVGGLAGYVLPKFEQPRAEFYIYDLAVDAAFRRRGIATAMIEELRRVAAERHIWMIYVQADLGDEAAIEFYTKLGAREDVVHFDIEPEHRDA